MKTTLFLLLLAGAALAQKPATGLRGRQYMYCPCSPSTRGFRVDALESVQEYIEEVQTIIAEGRAERTPADEVARELALKSQELWANCASDFGMEECVNADAALRADAKCAPNCASFCEYDRGSWRNNANGVYGPACDTVPAYKSKAVEINDPAAAEPGDVVATTPRNPTPGVEKPLSGRVRTRPLEANGRPAAGSSSIPAGKGEPTVDVPSTAGSKSATPATPVTVSSSNGETESNGATETATTPPDGSQGGLQGVPMETLIATTNDNTPLIGTPLNEGCVAVEHLEGYALQHAKHLERAVLCAKGFCATPNHALIVDGKWTSMARLCKEWECVSTVKLVNNLKVVVNRRATHGEFTITPYDMRFPRWCVWAVQIAEDVFHLVAIACVLGVVTAFFLLVGCAVKEL